MLTTREITIYIVYSLLSILALYVLYKNSGRLDQLAAALYAADGLGEA